MFLPVYLQAWIRNPPEGRYWVVCEDGNETRPVEDQEAFHHLGELYRRERQHNQSISDERAMATLNAKPTYPELRPWLERTGWEVTYRNAHRVLLRSLAEMPSRLPSAQPLLLGRAGTGDGRARLDRDVVISADDEQKTAVLCMAAMSVMERCEHTARATSRNLPCWLRSLRPNATYSKPFAFVSRPSSRMKYYALLKRFLATVFRASRMPVQVRRRAAGIWFKKAQLDLIEAIWNHEAWERHDALTPGYWGRQAQRPGMSRTAQDPVGRGDGDRVELSEDDDLSDAETIYEDDGEEYAVDGGDECEDGEGGEGGEDNGRDGEVEAEAARTPTGYGLGLGTQAAEVLELLFVLLLEFCKDEVTDGRPASTLLVYFSGILGFSPDCNSYLLTKSYTPHLAGLICVQRLLFLEYALPAREYPLLAIPQRPRRDQIAKFQAVRQRYAVLGAQSPFEELVSLMAYGRATAASDPPSFLLRWSDDGQSVAYNDRLTITMAQYRALVDVVLDEAERLCDELMYQWKPDVDLGPIKDSLTNRQHGHSFVAHPENGLGEAYLRLSFKACTSQLNSLSKNGRWNWREVQTYVRKETAFCEAIALLMLVAGGGQPRAPDLLHLRCEIAMPAERGIFVYGGSVMYLTRSQKAKRSTNREFYVARFLPVQPGHLLFKYLVYIRPVVDMLMPEQTPTCELVLSPGTRRVPEFRHS